MDAQLSTMLSIALARALEARPSGVVGAARAGIPGTAEQSAWVAPRVAAAISREANVTRSPLIEEPTAPESATSGEGFVSGTLDMVAYGRYQADALVEYLIDRDTVP